MGSGTTPEGLIPQVESPSNSSGPDPTGGGRPYEQTTSGPETRRGEFAQFSDRNQQAADSFRQSRGRKITVNDLTLTAKQKKKTSIC